MCVLFLLGFIVFRLAFFCFRLRKHDFETHLTIWIIANLNAKALNLPLCCSSIYSFDTHTLTHIHILTHKLLLSKQNLLFAFFIFILILFCSFGVFFCIKLFLVAFVLGDGNFVIAHNIVCWFWFVHFGISFIAPAIWLCGNISVSEDNMTVFQEQQCHCVLTTNAI